MSHPTTGSRYFELLAVEPDKWDKARRLGAVPWAVGRLTPEARTLLHAATGTDVSGVEWCAEEGDGLSRLRLHWMRDDDTHLTALGAGSEPDEAFENALRALT